MWFKITIIALLLIIIVLIISSIGHMIRIVEKLTSIDINTMDNPEKGNKDLNNGNNTIEK